MGREDARPVIVIFGPTASGKTALAERLFADGGPFAVSCGIISADSMQVYRLMDIGTAKPDRELLTRLPHECIDVCDITHQFSASDFVLRANAACERLYSAGRVPVLLGGTGFYIRTFLCGLPDTPPSDPFVRTRLQERLAVEGSHALYRELTLRDPDRAQALHPNDGYRITRALEILEVSGSTMARFTPKTAINAKYSPLVLSLTRPREELYRRIDRRVDEMFAQGLAREVRSLLERGFSPSDPGMKAIGYREFFIDGTFDADLQAVASRIKQNTKKYAKRQETYIKTVPGVISAPADAWGTVSWLLANHLSTSP
jgi:tRNA dimethylallyltransferase